jgi:DNA-binding CsgD family transcriptional regulator
MIKVGEYFSAYRWALFFFDKIFPPEIKAQKLFQLATSVKYNPVLRYLVEYHAPVHEEILLPPGMWQKICPRSDHGHVMIGPLVNEGFLIGGIALTRTQESQAFCDRDLFDLGALCLHLSTWQATARSRITRLNSPDINCLTPREIQIAELVAKGLTNAEIGKVLWIQENSVKQALKRMFRKLNVSSRAEMVAHLSKYI